MSRQMIVGGVCATAMFIGLLGCGDDDVTPVTDLGVGVDMGPGDVDMGPGDVDMGPSDAGASFQIADPATVHYGKTYAEWGSEWWQWSYAQAWTTHPLNDTTGANCHVGQDPAADAGVTREVFFLGGTFGGDATRACTVPAATPLFFPIYNWSWDNCGVPLADQLTVAELQAALAASLDATTGLTLEIDGVSVGATVASLASYRTPSEQFSYTVPAADSVYDHFGSTFEGLCDPSFQAGYWIMLEPLPAGTHTIHFSAAAPGTPADPDAGVAAMPWTLDVTYNLTVE